MQAEVVNPVLPPVALIVIKERMEKSITAEVEINIGVSMNNW